MKKSLKIIGIILLVLMGLGGLSRVIVKPVVENSFEEQIRRANRDCPIPVANGVGQVSSISMEDGFIVYKLDYKPEYLNIDAYRNKPEATRDMFYLAFLCMNGQGGHSDMMSDELIKRGYGLRIVASNGVSSFTSELSPEYIKEMRNRINVNPTEALHDALTLKFETENCSFPVKIDKGMILTGLGLKDNNIIVEVQIDETLYDLDSFASISEEFADNIITEANNGDPELGAMLDLCKISHTGLTYRMIGNHSKKHHDMNISSSQISKIGLFHHKLIFVDMDSLYKDIKEEIQKLRQLKHYVFEEDFSQCDITASNICLSADLLLLPLYWYITSTPHAELQPMEEYMKASVESFDQRASMLIPRLIERTRELDNQYISKPFRQYRNLLKKCFPQYAINSNQK